MVYTKPFDLPASTNSYTSLGGGTGYYDLYPATAGAIMAAGEVACC